MKNIQTYNIKFYTYRVKSIWVVCCISLLFSCKKTELGPQCISCDETPITNTTSSDVLILNEGNFGWSNASISIYNKESHSLHNNVFKNANNGVSLGDVAQSFLQIDDKGYIVVNNSGKIEVVNTNDFKSVATINGFNSPRFMLKINSQKAYVTDLYSSSIQIVNLQSNTIVGNIPTPGWTEQLVLLNDTAYVCDMKNNNILLINANNDQLIDSVKVGISPNSIVLDKNNKLWVLCSGGFSQENARLFQFNPSNRTVEKILTFSNINDSPNSLCTNGNKDELFFINNHVYKVLISDTVIPATPIISTNGNIFYGLGIDPENNDIYVADAVDYVQNGIVFRYTSSGSLITYFTTGLIPSKFWFIN